MARGEGAPIDRIAIETARDVFLDTIGRRGIERIQYRNRQSSEFVETPADMREVRISVPYTIQADADVGYFDITWWENGDYKYHYKEGGLEFRFGREVANRDSAHPVNHFHPPEDLSLHQESWIKETHPELVTRAVIANWWVAVQSQDPNVLNSVENPP